MTTAIDPGLVAEVTAAVEKARDEIIQLARSLVRIPSENLPPTGMELGVQNHVQAFLETAGIPVDRFTLEEAGIASHPAFMPGREYGANRPDVVGTLKGSGGGRSLIFSGHADTVPVGGGAWARDPFSGDVEDGKLHGRGAFDMKAGLAASLMAVKLLKSMQAPLRGDLLVESVVDEEFAGGHGTLAARLRGHRADAAVVGENSGMTIYHAHRGFFLVQLTVEGAGGIDFNVGAGELANPVDHVGRLIEWINEYRHVRRERAAVPPAYREMADPSPVLLTQVSSGDLGPTHPIAVPSRCTLEVYIQTMPGETREAIEREFFGFLDALCRKDPYFVKHPLVRHFPYRWIPGSAIPADHPLVAAARGAAGAVVGRDVPARAAPYPCDLYIFNDLFRIPGILLGPRGDHAHAPDEYVLVEDLIAVTRIDMLTALSWCNTSLVGSSA